jgi:hypothetical protein
MTGPTLLLWNRHINPIVAIPDYLFTASVGWGTPQEGENRLRN